MTAEEFIASITGFLEKHPIEQAPYLVYFLTQELKEAGVSATRLNQLRRDLHLPVYKRTSQLLSERTKKVGEALPTYVRIPDGYVLARGERERIAAEVTGRPSAKATARDLKVTLGTIADSNVKRYLEEAIGCFEHGFFRASIVFTWCAAFSVFRQWLFANSIAQLNNQMKTWKTPKTITAIEDFQELSESVVINTARAASTISKEAHKQLTSLLDERNSYAHPSARTASSPIAEAFIEKAIKEVITTYR